MYIKPLFTKDVEAFAKAGKIKISGCKIISPRKKGRLSMNRLKFGSCEGELWIV
jgi:hypothetical protein